MRKNYLLFAITAFGTTGFSPAMAQEEDVPSRLSFSMGADYTTQYYFRGIVQETDGFIIQPWFEVGVDLITRETWELDLFFGTWSSVHGDTDTAQSDSLRNYYELDVYGGAALSLGRWGFSLSYIAYTSPSDAFDTVQEIDLSVSYDDSENPLLGPIALSPSATIALEFGDNAADGADTGAYLQLGIEPSHTYDSEGLLLKGLTVSLPITVGLSLDDYYEFDGGNDTFGYFDIGLAAALPILEGRGLGDVEISAALHALFLSDDLSSINEDRDDFELIFTLGLSVSF